MRMLCTALAVLSLGACNLLPNRWKTIDEGFTFSVPADLKKRKVSGIDSHVGEYRGSRINLEFDDVDEMLFPREKASEYIFELARKKSNSALLKPNEEIWVIDKHLARFNVGPADRETYGKRRFKNVAELSVPFDDPPRAISILVFYKGDQDLSDVKHILKSLQWNTKTEQGAAANP